MLFVFLPSVLSICEYPGLHPDLPNPPYLELKSFPMGTWLIPMDDKQYDSSGNFNLAAYGFIIRALWENLDVYWIINGCKSNPDGIDFTVSVRRLYPLWNEVPHRFEHFKYGAFAIIQPHFAYRVYKRFAEESASLGLEPPSIYEMEEDMILEVRHKLKQKPRVAVLVVEDEANFHTDIMKAAGLIEGKHFFNDVDIDKNSCYSLVSHPGVHLDGDASLSTNVLEYVKSGGNFLAQDEAALIYEQKKHFLMDSKTTSLVAAKTKWSKSGSVDFGSVRHPDLAYLQFDHSEGFDYASNGGSWSSGNMTAVKNHLNNVYVDLNTHQLFKTMAGQVIGYPEGKLGGMVFYMAGQQYTTKCKGPLCSMSALRMYMNAVLIPAKVNKTCKAVRVKKNKRCQSTGPSSHWCPDDRAPQYCNWDTACQTLPPCINFHDVLTKKLSCVPNYCDSCAGIWSNVMTGEVYPCTEVIKLYPRCGRCQVQDHFDPDCCTPENRCERGKGGCTTDADCHAGLICGVNNCGVGWPSHADCCTVRAPDPTKAPTHLPTKIPTKAPSKSPTKAPSKSPTKAPTRSPTKAPTIKKTKEPTKSIPEIDRCHDLPNWVDTNGHTCENYRVNQWCVDGKSFSFHLKKVSGDGVNASTACCICSNITDFTMILVFKLKIAHKELRANETFQEEYIDELASTVGISPGRISVYSIDKIHSSSDVFESHGYAYFALKILPSTDETQVKTQAIYNEVKEILQNENSDFHKKSALKQTDTNYFSTDYTSFTYDSEENQSASQGTSTGATIIATFVVISIVIASLCVARRFMARKKNSPLNIDYSNMVNPHSNGHLLQNLDVTSS